MTQTSWDAEQARRIGAAIKSIRGERSAQWLSDQTDEAGHKVTRSTIADIENARRKYVSTAELSVLAWALKVPPIRLLYPDLPDGPVEIVPGKHTSSVAAVAWFSGELTFLPRQSSRGEAPNDVEWLTNAKLGAETQKGSVLVQLSRERIRLESKIESLTSLVARLKASEDTVVAAAAANLVEDIVSAEARIEAINMQLRGMDGAVVDKNGG